MAKIYDEYEEVKKILIRHDVLHKDIDQLDDPILMQDLYTHFQEEMPYGTQKARDGDPDEYIYNKLEDLGLPLGRTTIIELHIVKSVQLKCREINTDNPCIY